MKIPRRTCSSLVLLVAVSAFAQCGKVNDSSILVAKAYTSFAPPALGQSYWDPIYGCPVRRISNGREQHGSPVRHEYANVSAVNADDTLIELMNASGWWYISDLSGHVVVPMGGVPWGGGSGARWSPLEPRVLYFKTGAVLKRAVIRSSCQTDCPITSTVMRDFPEYKSINFGGGEGDMQDGDHLVIEGTCNGTTCAAGTGEIFVYTISSDNKGAVLNFGTRPFDNAQLTPTNHVVVNWGVNGREDCYNGPCYYGFELFDESMQYVRSLTRTGQHSVEIGFQGHEYLVHVDADGVICPPNQQGIAVIDVNEGVASGKCYLADKLPWNASIHVGGTKNGSGWIVVSHTDYQNPGSASLPLARNWYLPTLAINNAPSPAGYWGVGSNEISLLRVDGSTWWRLAHHRSRPNARDYWKIPRASISRDGRIVVFDSDFATGSGDVYVVFPQ